MISMIHEQFYYPTVDSMMNEVFADDIMWVTGMAVLLL